MEIILKQDIKNLGYKDDLVKVRNGYGLNYLIPRDMAIVANETNKKIHAENVRQKAHKEAKLKDSAEKLATSLKDTVITVGAKAGENGKIFGSVTSLQIAEAFKKLGHDIDRKSIAIESDIKQLGTYTAKVKLHRDISAEVKFEVVAE
jgi:large subunit ribosomal protein L9